MGKNVRVPMSRVTETIWKQFALLLDEAVSINSYKCVRMLLQKEVQIEEYDKKTDPNKYRPKYAVPLITAITDQKFTLLSLFLKHQYEIPHPHTSYCECEDCQIDRLGRTRVQLLTLKALGDPVWLSLKSGGDPFLTLFKLNELQTKFRDQNDSFQHEYNAMYAENEITCVRLLDEVTSQEEGATLMRYKTLGENKNSANDLDFINLAIDYNQKEVVAHSVCQHFLTSAVFDEIPRWHSSWIAYKVFIVIMIALLYPVTSFLNIILPMKYFEVSSIAMRPFVKFINGAASFITFLALLIALGSTDRDGVRVGHQPTALEIVVLVWIVGFCYGECKQVYKRGVGDYLSSGWNWVDIGMDSLMLFAFVVWFILTYHPMENKVVHEYVVQVADGAFTVGIILSFFRIIYLCQITSYLGLLQLCLGEMVMVILQFAFICIIVLLAFTVGMVYLFNASKIGITHKHSYAAKHENNTIIFSSLTEKFNGFVSTMFTMIYVSLSMEDTETIQDFEDGTLIHLWANLLFIVYFAITMIVILNMLIAMMNNSYMKIADNLVTEHMYSRTTLWMEYVGDEQTRPVPFNLIPSTDNLKSLILGIRKLFMKSSCCRKLSSHQTSMMEREEVRKYSELCDSLMLRYLRRKYGKTIFDQLSTTEDTASHEPIEEEEAFIQKIEGYFKVWDTVQESKSVNGVLQEGDDISRDSIKIQSTSFVDSGYVNEIYVSDEEIDDNPSVWSDFVVT